jgi:hypothetical protein
MARFRIALFINTAQVKHRAKSCAIWSRSSELNVVNTWLKLLTGTAASYQTCPIKRGDVFIMLSTEHLGFSHKVVSIVFVVQIVQPLIVTG